MLIKLCVGWGRKGKSILTLVIWTIYSNGKQISLVDHAETRILYTQQKNKGRDLYRGANVWREMEILTKGQEPKQAPLRKFCGGKES